MLKFEDITVKNAIAVMNLTKTLSNAQRKNVADNSVSIAQGSLSDHGMMKSVVLDDGEKRHIIGFLMLHIGSSIDDGIEVEGPYLWRFMISSLYQGKGYGRHTLDMIVSLLDQRGYHSLETSVMLGEESPLEFYLNYGFEKSGELFGDEVGLIYTWK